MKATLEELYVDELKDLYNAENQILKALPRMAKAASHPELRDAFEEHEEQTRRHVDRLERIFKDLGQSPKGKKCVGMEGLIEEGAEIIKEKPETDVLDAGLISKAQHVEHYEIAGYGSVRTWARTLGHEAHAELLQKTLDEEEETDRKLTDIAESSINLEAAEGEEAREKRMPSREGRGARSATSARSSRSGSPSSRSGRSRSSSSRSSSTGRSR